MDPAQEDTMERVAGSRLDRMHRHRDKLRSALKPLQEMATTDGFILPGRFIAARLSIAVAELQAIDNQMRVESGGHAVI